MTRINIGIPPAELCDQHLVAEYRELPRMQPFAVARWEKYQGTGPRPELPTLGSGHMAYFLPYGTWLRDRWTSLVVEMSRRGFAANLTWRPYPMRWLQTIPREHEALAAPLLRARINLRLLTMKARWSPAASRQLDWA